MYRHVAIVPGLRLCSYSFPIQMHFGTETCQCAISALLNQLRHLNMSCLSFKSVSTFNFYPAWVCTDFQCCFNPFRTYTLSDPLHLQLSIYKASIYLCDTFHMFSLSFRYLICSIGTSFHTGFVPIAESPYYIAFHLQLGLQSISPFSLSGSWSVNLIFKDTHRHIGQKEFAGTNIKFSFFSYSFALWMTSSPPPFFPISIGEKNWLVEGLSSPISLSSLSSAWSKGRRWSWQCGPTVSDSILQPMGFKYLFKAWINPAHMNHVGVCIKVYVSLVYAKWRDQ